ncbi:hypothetical protein HDU98_010890 [Podochytrium sp. JEL0797]|nr:hypothetical protein HDU98_010890 [Podochytrium sp. JEL0797]
MSMNAQEVAAVYPLVGQNAFFGIGQTNAITWTNNVTNPLTEPIVTMQIVLGTGSTNQITDLYPLASVAFPATTCYEWTPTANLTNPRYTLTFNGMDVTGTVVSTNYVTWFGLAAVGSRNYPAATTCAGASGQDVQVPTGGVSTSAGGGTTRAAIVTVTATATFTTTTATATVVTTKNAGAVTGGGFVFLTDAVAAGAF